MKAVGSKQRHLDAAVPGSCDGGPSFGMRACSAVMERFTQGETQGAHKKRKRNPPTNFIQRIERFLTVAQ